MYGDLSVPSPAWERSICFNKCLLYLSLQKGKEYLRCGQWAFLLHFAGVRFGQPLAGPPAVIFLNL